MSTLEIVLAVVTIVATGYGVIASLARDHERVIAKISVLDERLAAHIRSDENFHTRAEGKIDTIMTHNLTSPVVKPLLEDK